MKFKKYLWGFGAYLLATILLAFIDFICGKGFILTLEDKVLAIFIGLLTAISIEE